MKKTLFWPYKFPDMKETWKPQVLWIAKALEENGFEIFKHPKFICDGLNCTVYDWKQHPYFDIVVYNHADISHLIGDILPSKLNLFLKPTVPTKDYATLDTLGYGPFSSIAYHKPNFESINFSDVKNLYNTKIASWIQTKENKWGKYYTPRDISVDFDNYYLVLGQCAGDEVVTRHDFGNYIDKLESTVKELSRIDNRTIIVKLHPYMDGEYAVNNNFSKAVGERLARIDKKVKVFLGKANIHNFLEKAYCVLLANSGSGIEAMMHNKPIISWGYPEYHWVTYDLRHLSDLINAIQLKWFNKEKQAMWLYWYLEKYCIYNQQTTNNRIKELISGE